MVASVDHQLMGEPGFSYAVLLSYRLAGWDGVKTDYESAVELVRTACHFGGSRWWFVCSLLIDGKCCGRRVRKLYLPPGGRYFGCRRCYKLTYRSAQEHDKRVNRLLSLSPERFFELCKDGNFMRSKFGLFLKALDKILA